MYKVDIYNKGEYDFQVSSKDYQFTVSPKGKGISPSATFLASLGACIGLYIRKYAEGAKLPLPEFDISVEAEFSRESFVFFKEINVSIDLKGAQLDERRKTAIVNFAKNCPIHNTLKTAPSINCNIK